jgi:hypothetical protein
VSTPHPHTAAPHLVRIPTAVFIVLLCMPCVPGSAYAGDEEHRGLLHYPVSLAHREFRSSLDIAYGKIPEDIIEEAAYIRAPLFIWEMRFGLNENFHAVGSVSTQIITNHFALGASYVHAFDRLNLEAGYRLAYWFGFLNIEGFDNSASGWINYPSVAAGYDFGPLALTLRGEMSIVTNISTYAGDIEVSSDYNFFNGVSVSLLMEQPLWKDNFVTLGLRVNRVKFFYPTWPLFPTFNRYYTIPEIMIGMRL